MMSKKVWGEWRATLYSIKFELATSLPSVFIYVIIHLYISNLSSDPHRVINSQPRYFAHWITLLLKFLETYSNIISIVPAQFVYAPWQEHLINTGSLPEGTLTSYFFLWAHSGDLLSKWMPIEFLLLPISFLVSEVITSSF